MGKIVNKAELAKTLGRSERNLTELQKEGLPVKKIRERGQSNDYDTADVINWLIKRASDTSGAMEKAKLRLTVAQADKAELEADELRGSLIRLDDMKTAWLNVFGSFRARILGMPARLTPQIAALRDHVKINNLLTDYCHEALNELAQYDPEINEAGKGSSKAGNKHRRRAAASDPD